MAKAFGFVDYGGPETQEFLDRPELAPGPGRIAITVRAAGVNPVDSKVRRGLLGRERQLPAVMGQEASGVVQRVGPGVDGFAPGDEVFGVVAAGAFAEQTLLRAESSARKPSAVGFDQAAVLAVAAATADDALRDLGLAAGRTLLIVGASGGVGGAAAQLARRQGLTVLGTTGEKGRPYLESLGAVPVRYGEGVAERLAAAAPEGVDAVLDLVGGEALRAVAPALTDRANLVSTADPVTAADLGGRYITRSTTSATLAALAALVAAGELDPHIVARYPLAHAAEAVALVESGHPQGKVVLEVS
ncbi:NADP-dependent oxidoreductase [Kitasatospora sp. NPDC051170]|uniref:NADP-dependent oxidoreductase n=1 Tax=Kitasatospora sp. NPDC051170 TaxID=3364056 RepID=UPI00379A9BBF